jgi:hypothetical protein
MNEDADTIFVSSITYQPDLPSAPVPYASIDQPFSKIDGDVIEPNSNNTDEISSTNNHTHKEILTYNSKIQSIENTKEIHEHFKKTGKIPTFTSYVCAHDCHHFDTYPYMMPIRKINNKYYVARVFCSKECLVAFIETQGYLYGDPSTLYTYVHELYANKKRVRIQKALPVETLQEHGGAYTIEQFREKNNYYNLQVDTIYSPIIPIHTYTDENIVQHKISPNSVSDVERINKASDSLRLKRGNVKKKISENSLQTYLQKPK